ncbi:DUF4431 domain-containing protein [Bdellovibrionota bacterium FG-1]
MARSVALLVVLSYLCAPYFAHATSSKFHYEPEKVTLTGTIEKQTFPGRPGYESIKNGDEIERGWYLRLADPIDVEETKNDTDPNSSTERNVRILQLTWESGRVEDLIRPATGKSVKLFGHLFHALSGHHHARVLFWVDSCEVINR